jgi:hypothetical protein
MVFILSKFTYLFPKNYEILSEFSLIAFRSGSDSILIPRKPRESESDKPDFLEIVPSLTLVRFSRKRRREREKKEKQKLTVTR